MSKARCVHGPASGSGAGGFGTEPCQAARGWRPDLITRRCWLSFLRDANAREARMRVSGPLAKTSTAPLRAARSMLE
jgi:hypothetical protein